MKISYRVYLLIVSSIYKANVSSKMSARKMYVWSLTEKPYYKNHFEKKWMKVAM